MFDERLIQRDLPLDQCNGCPSRLAQARLVSIEQPELHIHPKLQTELGDLFVAAVEPPGLTEDDANVVIRSLANPLDEAGPLYGTNGRFFVIETHSEHLVLRLLRRIREAGENQVEPGQPVVGPALISVNYVEPDERGVRLHHLRVDETGEFIDRWPMASSRNGARSCSDVRRVRRRAGRHRCEHRPLHRHH